MLLVKRCRYLEEAGCAAICVNTCKMPTQSFFNEDMGVALQMVPDYESYECKFLFGVTPTSADEHEARNTPCLSSCSRALKSRAEESCGSMGSGGTDDRPVT